MRDASIVRGAPMLYQSLMEYRQAECLPDLALLQSRNSVGRFVVVLQSFTGAPAPSRYLVRFQRQTACGSAIAKIIRLIQSVMDLRLFECRRLILVQQAVAFGTFADCGIHCTFCKCKRISRH